MPRLLYQPQVVIIQNLTGPRSVMVSSAMIYFGGGRDSIRSFIIPELLHQASLSMYSWGSADEAEAQALERSIIQSPAKFPFMGAHRLLPPASWVANVSDRLPVHTAIWEL